MRVRENCDATYCDRAKGHGGLHNDGNETRECWPNAVDGGCANPYPHVCNRQEAPMKVQVTQDVSEAQILNSLINWSDSGIANFYVEHIDHRPYRMDGDDDYLNLPVVVTLQEDCEVDGKLEFVLDQDAIERGVAALAKLYPRVFAQEFPADPDAYNGDASTADLFVQCCLFGKEVFG